ncbi:hypothetical protein Aph01nite_73490 [Acrocarpospora phusangensis]|uniref:DUF4276 family protein n=1 Tax=Acrocarpospora phusangensis TaxID=1070424 RepID=A0A919QH87_9ACTN|nr:DUF4276 family protein [Acrocarpospora phusangensis]GIH29039.1 hypothetical protein Aph01nite_73490 [Acrocarpospora phusangensis]
MKRVHILVEGQTEEVIATQILRPYYAERNVHLSCSLLATKRSARGPDHKGGVTSWERMRGDIVRLLNDSSLTALTTLIDYYAFPSDAPGMADRPPNGTSLDRVRHVECALAEAIDNRRFIPHLVLHETEAWVLADCDRLAEVMGGPCHALAGQVALVGGPELVNDHPTTAPSKRIAATYQEYRKTVDGPMVVDALGVEGVRARCPHADERLTALDRLLGI